MKRGGQTPLPANARQLFPTDSTTPAPKKFRGARFLHVLGWKRPVWHNHCTRLFIHRQLNPTRSTDASLRCFWGSPGSKDIVDRTNSIPGSFAQSAFDWDRPFQDAIFLNLGLEYRVNRNARFRVDGYNLLGILQSDLNRRIFYGHNSFISEAPALGVSGEVCY